MYNRGKKAIFLDIDGTLLPPGEPIRECVKEGLRKVRNHGHQVFIATGRAYCSLPEELKDIELDGLIASAGSDIWFHGQNICRMTLPQELVEKSCRVLRNMDAVYLLEGFDRIYVCRKAQRILLEDDIRPEDNPELVRWKTFFRQKKNLHPVEAWDPVKDPVPKITFMVFSEEQAKELEEAMSEDYHVVFFPAYFQGVWNGELIAKTADKGEAVKKTAELLHMDIADTIAFGDSMNDYEMIQQAGCGVVMGNGDDKVKQVADRICESVEEDGVIRELERMGLL